MSTFPNRGTGSTSPTKSVLSSSSIFTHPTSIRSPRSTVVSRSYETPLEKERYEKERSNDLINSSSVFVRQSSKLSETLSSTSRFLTSIHNNNIMPFTEEVTLLNNSIKLNYINNNDAWITTECLTEFEALICRLVYFETDGKFESKKPTVFPDIIAVKTNQLNSAIEVRNNLKLCQKWLVRFTVESTLSGVCSKLIDICNLCVPSSVRNSQTDTPSTNDKLETIDELIDTSAEFFILETIHFVLLALLTGDTDPEKYVINPATCPILVVPDMLIRFLIAKINTSASAGVRRISAICLGDLSYGTLESIVYILITKMTHVKRDTDEREFTYFQRITKYLNFGLEDRDRQFDVTNSYLAALVVFASRIDRGVLKLEICACLKVILTRILKFKFAKARQLQIWKHVENLFDLIYHKWVPKPKYYLGAMDCVVKILVLSPLEYYNKINSQVYSTLLAEVSSSSTKLANLPLLVSYFREIHPDLIRAEMDPFTNQLKGLMSVLISKNTPLDSAEIPPLGNLLLEMGTLHTHFFFVDAATQFLSRKAPYTEDVKILFLSTLALLAVKRSDAVLTYDYSLGPLLIPFIEEKNTNEGLCAALPTFPAIRHPNSLRAKQTAASISRLMLSPDRSVATCALLSLHAFMKLSSSHWTYGLHLLFSVMIRAYDTPNLEIHVRLWNAVRHCSPSGVWESDWLEAVALLYLTSPEYVVRQQVFEALKNKHFTTTLSALVASEDNDSGTFLSSLLTYLRSFADTSSGVNIFAAEQIVELINAFPQSLDNLEFDSEYIQAFSNRLMFVCLVIKPSRSVVSTPRAGVVYDEYVDHIAKYQMEEVEALNPLSLIKASTKRHTKFFNTLVGMIHKNHNSLLITVIIDCLSVLSIDNYELLLNCIEDVPLEDAAFHPPLLTLIDRIYSRVSDLSQKFSSFLEEISSRWLDQKNLARVAVLSLQSKCCIFRLLTYTNKTHDSITNLVAFIYALIPVDFVPLRNARKKVYLLDKFDSLGEIPNFHQIEEECVKKYLSNPNHSLEELKEFESAASDCVTSLIEAGAGEVHIKTCVVLLHYFAFRGSHTHVAVSAGLAKLLICFPALIHDWLIRTYTEMHVFDDDFKSDGNAIFLPPKYQLANFGVSSFLNAIGQENTLASQISLLYLKAINSALNQAPEKFINTKSSFFYGKFIPHMILHLSSASRECRDVARLILMPVLRELYEKIAISPPSIHFNFQLHNISSSVLFASEIAPRCSDILNEILEEVDFIIFNLCDSRSEILLKIVLQWLIKPSNQYYPKLFKITQKIWHRPLTSSTVLPLWGAVSVDYINLFEYLLQNLSQNLYIDKSYEIADITRGIIHSLDKKLLPSCIEHCSSKLRKIVNVVPIIPDGFIEFTGSPPEMHFKKEASVIEQTSYMLLISILLSNNDLEDLPLLLQYSIVFFQNLEESKLLWMWIEEHAGAKDVSRRKSLRSLILKNASNQFQLNTIDPRIVLLKNTRLYNESVFYKWSEIAYNWALHSLDSSTSISLLSVYSLFQPYLRSYKQIQLMLNMYIAVKDYDFDKLKAVSDLLKKCEVPSVFSWKLIIGAYISLLGFSRKKIFAESIQFLLKLLSQNHESDINALRPLIMFSSTGTIQSSSGASAADSSIDVPIFNLLLKGSYSADTIIDTMSLGVHFVAAYPTDTNEKLQNNVLLWVLTCQVILSCSDPTMRFSDLLLKQLAKYNEFHDILYEYNIQMNQKQFSIDGDNSKEMSLKSSDPFQIFYLTFVEAFFDTLNKICDENDFNFIFKLLLNLLQNGDESWRYAILFLFRAGLTYHSPTRAIFLVLTEQLCFLYFDANRVFGNLIEVVSELLVSRCRGTGYEAEKLFVYNFAKPPPKIDRNDTYLQGDASLDPMCRSACLACFDTIIFPMLLQGMDKILEDASIDENEDPGKSHLVLDFDMQTNISASKSLRSSSAVRFSISKDKRKVNRSRNVENFLKDLEVEESRNKAEESFNTDSSNKSESPSVFSAPSAKSPTSRSIVSHKSLLNQVIPEDSELKDDIFNDFKSQNINSVSLKIQTFESVENYKEFETMSPASPTNLAVVKPLKTPTNKSSLHSRQSVVNEESTETRSTSRSVINAPIDHVDPTESKAEKQRNSIADPISVEDANLIRGFARTPMKRTLTIDAFVTEIRSDLESILENTTSEPIAEINAESGIAESKAEKQRNSIADPISVEDANLIRGFAKAPTKRTLTIDAFVTEIRSVEVDLESSLENTTSEPIAEINAESGIAASEHIVEINSEAVPEMTKE